MVYNEADILGQVLDHLVEHGVYFVIFDEGSYDGSIEIALSYSGRGLLEHRALRHEVMRWGQNLDDLVGMAGGHHPDWILKNDADEFLEPPNSNETLVEAISEEDRRGFNLIQFDDFEFRLTEKDYNSGEPDVRKKLRFYSWWGDFLYTGWKYHPGTTLRETAGHFPIFPRGMRAKISPRKFVMRHYRFRTPKQAVRRVFRDRLPRYAHDERAKGWHHQYDDVKEGPKSFVLGSKQLSFYADDGKWDRSRGVREHPEILPYPTREEVLVLARIQERLGLLNSDTAWRLLRKVRKMEEKYLTPYSELSRGYHHILKTAAKALASH
jgi:glycosyltransferase involved in cell wall biosynthesis